nr:MAG TPA: hypothetical protein [Caudoviricetes sp.]
MQKESLENSLNWVPKVQDRSGRISQAKGQGQAGVTRRAFFCFAHGSQ